MAATTGRREHGGGMATRFTAAFGALLLAALATFASPLAGAGELLAGNPHPSAGFGDRDVDLPYTGVETPADGPFSGHLSGATGLLGNMLETYATDPLLRPVSTLRSLGFLIKNTLADLATQALISMVHLPEITKLPIPPLARGPGMDLEEWERELDAITNSAPLSGSLEFLIDGDEYFPALVDSIEQASQSIHIRTYIFDNDDFAIQIADLLRRRSSEVDVKVSMDGIGTLTAELTHSNSMPASFDPPASIAEYLRSGSTVNVRTLTNPWFSGDHTKVTIVDREVAFLGGMNIGREYRYDWHDLMVRLEGAVVEELARESDGAWAKSGMLGDLAALFQNFDERKASRKANEYPIRVLHTRAQDSQIYEAQLAAIRRAQRYIYIENPYFSDDAILFELIAARRRGVDVRFVIAERGDMELMDMSNAQAINEMLANGIRVYMYPDMTHVKATIVDDWLMVGSANLDKLSLRVNNEINVATSHPQAVHELKRRLFHVDFERSVELTRPLRADLRYQLAETLADIFM